MLRERKAQTLGYQPDTAPQTDSAPAPPHKAYTRLPFTEMPPVMPAPIEPNRSVFTFGVLGPDLPNPNA